MLHARLRAAAGNRIPSDGLIAHYTMDNISGTTLVDETGNYDATINGATTTAGIIGDALSFDGVDDTLEIDMTAESPVTSIAFSFWIYRIQDNEANAIITFYGSTASNRITLHFPFSDGNWYWDFANISDGRTSGAFDPAWYSSWRHIVCQYDGNSVEFYVDNQLEGSVSASGLSASLSDVFGLFVAADAGSIDSSVIAEGDLDLLRIYSRALNASERQALYNEGA